MASDRSGADGEYVSQRGGRKDPGEESGGGSLALVVFLIGIVLLLFPEPVTSGIGLLLVVLGVIKWLAG